MVVETRYTSDSEYSPRNRKLNTLQPHHATTTSLSGLESLMDPGGRTVSANEAIGPYGQRVRKVPKNQRAFTSATAFDNQSYTVEVCNTSLGPEWGISDEAHRALAEIAVELYLEGNLDGFHYGPGGILFHRDVPGTYATACPGPCMDYERIARYALELLANITAPPIPEEEAMSIPVKLNGQHLFIISPEKVSHIKKGANYEWLKNAVAADDNWVDANSEKFDDLLDAFGIPRTAVNYNNGATVDPVLNTQEVGQTWSRAKEVQRAINDLSKPAPATT